MIFKKSLGPKRDEVKSKSVLQNEELRNSFGSLRIINFKDVRKGWTISTEGGRYNAYGILLLSEIILRNIYL
jgi:hypothetical protein